MTVNSEIVWKQILLHFDEAESVSEGSCVRKVTLLKDETELAFES